MKKLQNITLKQLSITQRRTRTIRKATTKRRRTMHKWPTDTPSMP